MEIAFAAGLGRAVGAILRWWVGVFMGHLSIPNSGYFSSQPDWFISGRIPGRIHGLSGVFDGGRKYDDCWLLCLGRDSA